MRCRRSPLSTRCRLLSETFFWETSPSDASFLFLKSRLVFKFSSFVSNLNHMKLVGGEKKSWRDPSWSGGWTHSAAWEWGAVQVRSCVLREHVLRSYPRKSVYLRQAGGVADIAAQVASWILNGVLRRAFAGRAAPLAVVVGLVCTQQEWCFLVAGYFTTKDFARRGCWWYNLVIVGFGHFLLFLYSGTAFL